MLYLVHPARPKGSERYWVQWGWVSVKSCTLFSIPIETLRLTKQTAGRLRQMGQAQWSAILLSGLVGAFWGSIHFYGAMLVCICLCVCVYMYAWRLRQEWWKRTNCSFSFTHHCSELRLIHRNESTAPPSTCTDRYDTCLCPLPSSKNTHNTPSVYACECNAFCVRRCDRFQIHHNLVSLRDLDCSF